MTASFRNGAGGGLHASARSRRRLQGCPPAGPTCYSRRRGCAGPPEAACTAPGPAGSCSSSGTDPDTAAGFGNPVEAGRTGSRSSSGTDPGATAGFGILLEAGRTGSRSSSGSDTGPDTAAGFGILLEAARTGIRLSRRTPPSRSTPQPPRPRPPTKQPDRSASATSRHPSAPRRPVGFCGPGAPVFVPMLGYPLGEPSRCRRDGCCVNVLRRRRCRPP